MICENGIHIGIKPSYWRKNLRDGAIIECENELKNCNGDLLHGFCIEGHMGPLCESCDYHASIWDQRYF
jgi:hypothetical protein